MFKAKGKVIYDPQVLRPNFKARNHVKWGVILTVPQSIIRYYQEWIRKELNTHVNNPAWNAHITITKNQEPTNKAAWKKHAGRVITFEYDPEFKMSDKYFWLPVKSNELSDIRVELGLEPLPYVPFHITIANLKGVTTPKPKTEPFKKFPWEL